MTKSITLFILITLSCSAFARDWYDGGTLHQSRVPEWKQSDYKNKLATASDFVAAVPNIKSLVKNSRDVKKFSKELVTCIDTSTNGVDMNDMTREVAFLCVKIMGWYK